jgi:lipopolysaccharide transport system permease protein
LQQTWTEEIKAEHSLFSINLREVWHYRDLLWLLVKRDYITYYKQTILGPIWFFLQPILTVAIYMVLFGRIARIPTDGVPELAFYLSGIVLWNYFSEALTKTSTVFRDNANVFGKVYFPRLIMPLSIVFSGLLKLGVQFTLFLGVVIYYSMLGKIEPNPTYLLLFPVLVLLMALFAMGTGLIFSSLTTKYRDLAFLLVFGVQLFMYVTPVVYPVSAVPPFLAELLQWNPLTAIFEFFRMGFLGSGNPNFTGLLKSTVIIALLFGVGVLIFNKVEKDFMDTV